MKRILLTFAMMSFVIPAVNAAQNAEITPSATNTTVNNQPIKFQNQRGSILEIQKEGDDKAGKISGTFSTAVSSKNCQGVIGKPQPITGFYNGNAVAITVNFPTCHAVVAFIGNFNSDNKLDTLWLDGHQGSTSNTSDWNNRLIGHDEFHRIG